MAWGIAELFRSAFYVTAERVVGEGGGLAELRTAFSRKFPNEAMPHANTFNAILNRARVSNDISGRLNRDIKPRAASYPQVPRGFDCEGFFYRVVVNVNRPVFGGGRRRENVAVPVEFQSESPIAKEYMGPLILEAIQESIGARDNYELLRAGIVGGKMRIKSFRVTSAYRC